MIGFHCLKCGDSRRTFYVYNNTSTHVGCGGHTIPIATLCSEPTVIDESDLAPGMVGVVTGPDTGLTYVVTMDARIERTGFVAASNGCGEGSSGHEVRRIAGVTP